MLCGVCGLDLISKFFGRLVLAFLREIKSSDGVEVLVCVIFEEFSKND